jgi:hypothetical protein
MHAGVSGWLVAMIQEGMGFIMLTLWQVAHGDDRGHAIKEAPTHTLSGHS